MAKKPEKIWCDHCNVALSVASIQSCIRKACVTKALLPDAKPERKVWK